MAPITDKSEIVRVLQEIADILELSDANPFQIMAYRNGSQNLEDWDGDLAQVVEHKKLTEIDGIGRGLSAMISDLFRNGRSDECDRLRALFPRTLRDLLSVPRLGPKKIRKLHTELGVDSLDSLEQAARLKKIRDLKGFGAKTEEGILRGVDRARRYGRGS